MYAVLVVILLLSFAILAWRDFKFALTLLIALLPTYLVRFELGIPWTLLEGFILVLFVVWFFKHHGRRLDLNSFGPYRGPLFLLLALACFSATWAPDINAALGIWKAYFVEPLMVFAMLRTTFTNRADWERALNYLSLTVIAIAVVGIGQKLTGYGLPAPWDLERRITSVFAYPNAVGLFVAPVIAALTVTLPHLKKGWGAVARVAAIVLGLVAIVLAETEAALVALPVALLITVLASTISPKIRVAISIFTLIAGGAAFALLPAVQQKLLLQDYSGQVRLSQWRETFDMLEDRPLQGAGLAGYPTVFEPYHDPALYEIFQYPHNVVLNLWVELGVFSIVALLWTMMAVSRVVHARRDDILVLAAMAALATMLIHGFVDVPFFKNDLAVLTVFFLAMTLVPGNHPGVKNGE